MKFSFTSAIRMSSDIIALLQLDRTLSSRVVVVKEINRCDSSFVTSCVLNHCIKKKAALCVLSTHNSFQHYQNVGLRMNYNLQKHVDSGLVDFHSLGDHCVHNLLSENSLPELFHKVRERITSMQQKNDEVNVIMDGVTHLFDLNYSVQQINRFCKELIELVTGCNNSFIVLHCHKANEDDVTSVMSNLLCHKAHTVLEVENLPSGLSADVSGHLTIKYPSLKFDTDHLYTMDMKMSRYLFKLFDRGVKLFAPGTV
ncbi:unnamed protein product [Arctia plantaginis]|uniref:Elongator complex protein 6 n=1 Tax=Arctia plantaginis TaxID=874455 RepID=A0A8S0ZBW4_ARCPL|nr:unnamed protein product [Arctia plantaginis]